MDNFILKNLNRIQFKVQEKDMLAFREGGKQMLEHAESLSDELKMMTNKKCEFHVAIWWLIIIKVECAMQYSE